MPHITHLALLIAPGNSASKRFVASGDGGIMSAGFFIQSVEAFVDIMVLYSSGNHSLTFIIFIIITDLA